MKKRLVIELVILALLGAFYVIADPANENALHDANAIYSVLADYNGETKRVTADSDGNLNINLNSHPFHISTSADTSGDLYTLGDSGSFELVDTTLDDSPTFTSKSTSCGRWRNIAFFVIVDITDAGKAPFLEITLEVSPDNSNWIDYDIIMDENGTDSPQRSLTYVIDDEDVFYIPNDFAAQYIRITFTGTNTDATNTIYIHAWINWKT